MFRKVLAFLLVPISLAFAAPPTAATQSVSHASDARVLRVAAPATPASAPNAALFNLSGSALLGMAAMGATEEAKEAKEAKKKSSRKINLSRTYIFNKRRYGPGRDVEVPSDFPELDDKGDVKFAEGTSGAENQAKFRQMASPPSTGGVNTGEAGTGGEGETVSGYPAAQLQDMKKDELMALAAEKGITVTRSDGEEGDPRKDDYVDALSQPA
jgi:hypothetical protein